MTTQYLTKNGHGDRECWRIIVQRESDMKFFEYTWQYYHYNYYFNKVLSEVFENVKTEVTYNYE